MGYRGTHRHGPMGTGRVHMKMIMYDCVFTGDRGVFT